MCVQPEAVSDVRWVRCVRHFVLVVDFKFLRKWKYPGKLEMAMGFPADLLELRASADKCGIDPLPFVTGEVEVKVRFICCLSLSLSFSLISF